MRTIGFDVETTKVPRHHPWLDGALLVAVGIVDTTGYKKTWVFNHQDVTGPINQKEMIAEIQEEFNSAGRIVGHNLKFDLNWGRSIGLNFDNARLYCTMLAEYLLRGQVFGDLNLASISKYYGLAPKMDQVKMFWDAGYETNEIPLHILLPYLEQDCFNTLAVWQRQTPKILAAGMGNLVKIQQETTRVLSSIECNGAKFNVAVAKEHSKDLSEKLAIADTNIKMEIGWDVNLSSGDELSVALFGGLLKRDGTEWVTRELKHDSLYYERKCVVETQIAGVGFEPDPTTELKKKGYYSTDKNTLKQLKAGSEKLKNVKQWLIERSVLAKAVETFAGADEDKGLINKVQSDGCLHGKYNQCVTKTGRFSSSDPNAQNLPRKGTSPIKQCIEPRYDWIVNADLSQIEWRAAAWASQDPVMIKEICEKVDVHRDNAINFFKANASLPNDHAKFEPIRTAAKVMTFRLIYGGSAYGFFMDQNMPRYSKSRWESIVDQFWSKYKRLKEWQDENIRFVSENDGLLISPTGRRFHIARDEKRGGFSTRQICNYPVQSLATADIMPLAMCLIFKLMREKKMRSIGVLQVHDSIVFDVPDAEVEELARICVGVFESLPRYLEKMFDLKWNVPLTGDVEIGRNYQQLVKYQKFLIERNQM